MKPILILALAFALSARPSFPSGTIESSPASPAAGAASIAEAPAPVACGCNREQAESQARAVADLRAQLQAALLRIAELEVARAESPQPPAQPGYAVRNDRGTLRWTDETGRVWWIESHLMREGSSTADGWLYQGGRMIRQLEQQSVRQQSPKKRSSRGQVICVDGQCYQL